MAVAKFQELIHVDANYVIAALGESSLQSRALERWLGRGAVVNMSAVARSEYLCGPHVAFDQDKSEAARAMVGEIEVFTEADAELASDLFNETGRRSRSHVDCMIAAHAIRREAQLATLNLQDFRRFANLRLAREL